MEEQIGPLMVILDIDELLVHTHHITSTSKINQSCSSILRKRRPRDSVVQRLGGSFCYDVNNEEVTVEYVKRPWLKEFLNQLGELRNVVVTFWTAAEKLYADAMLDEILPLKLQRCHRFYRENCDIVYPKNSKEIILKNVKRHFSKEELNRVVLFDDDRMNIRSSAKNSVLCHPFTGDLDKEPVEPCFLQILMDKLLYLLNIPDVRVVVKEVEADMEKAVQIFRPVRQIKKKKSSPHNNIANVTTGEGFTFAITEDEILNLQNSSRKQSSSSQRSALTMSQRKPSDKPKGEQALIPSQSVNLTTRRVSSDKNAPETLCSSQKNNASVKPSRESSDVTSIKVMVKSMLRSVSSTTVSNFISPTNKSIQSSP